MPFFQMLRPISFAMRLSRSHCVRGSGSGAATGASAPDAGGGSVGPEDADDAARSRSSASSSASSLAKSVAIAALRYLKRAEGEEGKGPGAQNQWRGVWRARGRGVAERVGARAGIFAHSFGAYFGEGDGARRAPGLLDDLLCHRLVHGVVEPSRAREVRHRTGAFASGPRATRAEE